MTIKRYFSCLLLVPTVVATLSTGCKKQLETTPQQSIDAATALSTRETIEASITAIYARLKNARQYGRDLIALPEALADNGYATNKSGRLLNESNNVQGAHFTGTVWSNSYAAINQVNLTLAAIPTVGGLTAADIARYEGQLYFLRGLFYFDLARVYAYIPGAVVTVQDRGGIVLVPDAGFATVDAAQAFKPARSPIDDAYSKVVEDLQNANSRLVFSSGADVSLANKAAAQLLLARVNLYRKNYADAKRWSDSCIASSGSRLTSLGANVSNWRGATHNETLFQVRFTTSAENIGVNESLQTSFTTLGAVGANTTTVGFGDLVPTITLLNDLGITLTGGNTTAVFTTTNATIATRSTDVRNQLYEPGTTGRGLAKVECTKYLGKSGFVNLDNVPVLRIVEAYLTRAEAQATTGSSVFSAAAALADLKIVKNARYTGYTGSTLETADNALTGTALFDEIFRQRRIEFAFEGFRFFDLKRLGRDIVKSAPSTLTVPFNDTRILPALPQVDIDANPNLKQNPGY